MEMRAQLMQTVKCEEGVSYRESKKDYVTFHCKVATQ